MATQLSIYNDALAIIGERRLVAITDATEPRRILDDLWVNAPKYCLEQGHWKFAQRFVEIDYSVTEVPTFGYRRAFAKPSDYVRVTMLCADEYLNSPITAYADRGLFWYADVDTIYVSYVSNHASYGGLMTNWPESFTLFVAHYLALRASTRLAGTADRRVLEAETQRAKLNALAKDAVAGPTQFLPSGSWARSRVGGGSGRHSRSSLYG
jgi:hypothetical protein